MERNLRKAITILCLTYDYRASMIRNKSTRDEVKQECSRINESIDRGIQNAFEDELDRTIMKKALIYGMGIYSFENAFCGKQQFYNKKNKAIRFIAHEMNLL